MVGFWRQARLFIVGLFNDYAIILDCMTETMMNELVSTWMEVVVAPFQLSYWQFLEGSEKAARTTVRTVSQQAKTELLTTRLPQSTRTREWAQVGSWCINKTQQDATVYRYLFTAKLLYMFRVSSHPSSGVNKTVTAASGTVLCTPDDGCDNTWNM